MSKVYIIVSLQGSTGQVAGLFGPDKPWDVDLWGVDGSAVRYQDAAPELREQVRNAVDEKFPDEASHLMSEMGDRAFLFTRRKAAREVLSNLNEEGTWEWRIIECGPPAARDMRPVLGWCIMHTGGPSGHNPGGESGMFKTRRDARAYFKRNDLGEVVGIGGGEKFYRIEPVYGAYRVDPRYNRATEYVEGSLRFRTKGAAEQFARDTYHDRDGQAYNDYRIVLHDEPVPESQLYVPL